MVNYKQVCERLESLSKLKHVMEMLHENGGMNLGDVPNFLDILESRFVSIKSGYSMGEMIHFRNAKGDVFYTIDQCKEYGKRCQYRAKHGYINVTLNKTQYRMLGKLATQVCSTKNIGTKLEIGSKIKKLLMDNMSTSDFKKPFVH